MKRHPGNRVPLLCVPGMPDSLGVQVPRTTWWGEVLAKRKGVTVRWGLKEAWSKAAT